jgi:hypothetical protein
MSTASTQPGTGNGASSAQELFALTDEQILQIEPEAQDVEIRASERTDALDPLREDLNLLAGAGDGDDRQRETRRASADKDDGRKAPAAKADGEADPQTAPSSLADRVEMANTLQTPPAWLAERMSDPQSGPEARALWEGLQTARQEATSFREVFAKPEEARAAASRARVLDEIDQAYFGVAGSSPEQLRASRAQLAETMLREDPAAFREMVFAGLRALETANQQAGRQGSAVAAAARQAQPTVAPEPQQEARVAAYATFERAVNEELERGVGGAIDRSLQQALPNAGRTENGSALKQRLAAAVRQDVERALQGDRSLGEQVARVLASQRLDHAARVQVVRLIGERAQQLVPGATRRVLADWTQTTLAAHGTREAGAAAPAVATRAPDTEAAKASQRPSVEPRKRTATPRRIDYRRVSDDDILNS